MKQLQDFAHKRTRYNSKVNDEDNKNKTQSDGMFLIVLINSFHEWIERLCPTISTFANVFWHVNLLLISKAKLKSDSFIIISSQQTFSNKSLRENNNNYTVIIIITVTNIFTTGITMKIIT